MWCLSANCFGFFYIYQKTKQIFEKIFKRRRLLSDNEEDVMDVEDENISTLMAMGFPEIQEIKRALRLAKNDLNEAVAILTHDQSSSSYMPPDLNIDVDMKDSSGSSKINSEDSSAEVSPLELLIVFCH